MPELWSHQDDLDAQLEGWAIIMSIEPGLTRIIAPDIGDKPFTSDRQVAEYVMERMHQGSAFHLKAWITLTKAQIHGARE